MNDLPRGAETLHDALARGQSDTRAFHPDRGDLATVDTVLAHLAALANGRGGRVLLGVETSGHVQGLVHDGPIPAGAGHRTYEALEARVRDAAFHQIHPPLPIRFTVLHDVTPGRDVAVIRVDANRSIYRIPLRGRALWPWHAVPIRTGNETRVATRSERTALEQRKKNPAPRREPFLPPAPWRTHPGTSGHA